MQANIRLVIVPRRVRDSVVLVRFLHFAGIFAKHHGARPLQGQFR